MAERRSDDLQRSRHEAALLLRLDPQNLSPSDALRCDLVATLRLSIDAAQADALEGRAADLGRLIVATESLVKLLPSEPPQPASRGADPRQIMWETYLGMRKRGELADPMSTHEGRIAEVERLKARIAELEAGAPAPDESTPTTPPDNVVPLARQPRARVTPQPPTPTPPPPAAASAVFGELVMVVDASSDESWRDYVEPDGSIRSTPFSGGKYWGPV
jgi:hypothetical protein